MEKQLTIDGNIVEDLFINKIRKEREDKINDKIRDKRDKENVNRETEGIIEELNKKLALYNKKIICLNVGTDNSCLKLNFKEDFMNDMVESFTGIYNWMVVNRYDALNLGDEILIHKNSIDEVVNVMKKLNCKLC